MTQIFNSIAMFSLFALLASPLVVAAAGNNAAEANGAKAQVVFSEETPPVVNDAGLVKKLRPVLEEALGAANVRTMEPMTYADDFSLMSQKVPSFYFQLGIRNEARGITAEQLPPIVALVTMTGISQVLALENALGVQTGHDVTISFIEQTITRLDSSP